MKPYTSLLICCKHTGRAENAALHMEHRYHNAFLIADSKEAWILDTVNRRWAARKVTDIAGISNCYSTEEHWDEESGDIKRIRFFYGICRSGPAL